MYKLRVAIVGLDYLRTRFDLSQRYEDISAAQEAVRIARENLFYLRCNRMIRDYTVDIIPADD